ncbi:hypothetical protein ACFL26_01505 [Patescibacteria group bacterium]
MNNPEHERFHPLDDVTEVTRIMNEGTDEEMRALHQHYVERGLMSEERFDRSVEHQRLRRQTQAEVRSGLARRIKERPEPTDEELSMGVYEEMIEPHVRDAVREMRAKGYCTVGSGFAEFDRQATVFAGVDFDELDEGAVQRLEQLGVSIKERQLSFNVKEVDLDKIRETWDMVAEALPNRGAPAPDNSDSMSDQFRRRMAEQDYDWYNPDRQ